MGDTMRAGFAAMIAVAVHLPTVARAQSGPADIEEALVISLHPSTPTTVQLRDDIVDAWIHHHGEFLMEVVGQSINLRPRPDTPAGTEAVIVVETSTARRRFRLRVVERPEDAIREIVLPEVKTVERTGEARQELPPDEPELPPDEPAGPPPAASTPEDAPAVQTQATLQPQASDEPAPAPARESGEPVSEPAAPAAVARAFDLSVHALVSLGYTALDVPGYELDNARQTYGALGLRLTLAPQAKSWALEASVSGERLAGSISYFEDSDDVLSVRSTWFRAEVGLRAWTGTRWMPTASAALGFQAQLQTKEGPLAGKQGAFETMEPGAALVMGMGLQYRAGDVLLGLEFQGRYGGPNDYFSIGALWTVGGFLDQGD